MKTITLPDFVNRGTRNSYILSMDSKEDATECYKSSMMGLGTPMLCAHERINKTCVNAYGMHLLGVIPYTINDDIPELTIAFVGAANTKKQDPATLFEMEMKKGGSVDKELLSSLKGMDYRMVPPSVLIPFYYPFYFTANPVGQSAQAVYLAQQMNDWHAGKVDTSVVTATTWPRAEALFAEFILFAEKMGCSLDKLTENDRTLMDRYPNGWESLPEEEKYDVPEFQPGIYEVVHKHAPYTPTMRL